MDTKEYRKLSDLRGWDKNPRVKKKRVRTEYMREFMRKYYLTENGKKRIQEKNKRWEQSLSGKTFRKNRKANLRGARGTYSQDYFNWLVKKLDFKCISCGQQKKIEVDHILPIARGGLNVDWNIQPLCISCNRKKSSSLILTHLDNYKIDMLYAEWLILQ